jgi:hypothetical protein
MIENTKLISLLNPLCKEKLSQLGIRTDEELLGWLPNIPEYVLIDIGFNEETLKAIRAELPIKIAKGKEDIRKYGYIPKELLDDTEGEDTKNLESPESDDSHQDDEQDSKDSDQ